jgi:hypothetical protein
MTASSHRLQEWHAGPPRSACCKVGLAGKSTAWTARPERSRGRTWDSRAIQKKSSIAVSLFYSDSDFAAGMVFRDSECGACPAGYAPPYALRHTAFSCGSGSRTAALKKTPLNQKRLAYPKVTRRAAAGRVQRHVPDSIATLRYLLARGITKQLDRCPCCAMLRSNHHL